MKKHQRRIKASAATRDRSGGHGKETVPRKTYNLRKRKCESGQHGQDNNSTKDNPKRKRIQSEHNDQRTDRKVTPSARGRTNHALEVSKLNDKQENLQDARLKVSPKRKLVNKSEKGTHLNIGFQSKKGKRVLRSSYKHAYGSQENVNKHPSSQLKLQIKKNRDKKADLPRRNLPEKLRKQSKQSNTRKPRVRRSAFDQKSNRKKEDSKAENFKKSKAKTIKQTSPRKKRTLVNKSHSVVAMADRRSEKDFSNLFLKKITVKLHPTLDQKEARIYGISVSEDNLVCVNYYTNRVDLRNTTGEVIRTFELDFKPVFNCCTPSGDILVTQGYGITKPTITSISREGNIKVFADLSSYASNLCGIFCQDEIVYVVAFHAKDYNHFIIKLDMNGEVECVYNTQRESDNINRIISLNGQIVAVRTSADALIPLEANQISSVKMNKVSISSYSASASVDKIGNVIMASNSSLLIINPSLEYMHKIDTGTSERITSTAVDQQNQLWFGTESGRLYSTKYLK